MVQLIVRVFVCFSVGFKMVMQKLLVGWINSSRLRGFQLGNAVSALCMI